MTHSVHEANIVWSQMERFLWLMIIIHLSMQTTSCRQFILFQTLPKYLTIILRGNFCALPGVQGAGPADAARRCGRSDVLVAGVLRREGQPGRGVVLSGLVLVSKIKSDLA